MEEQIDAGMSAVVKVKEKQYSAAIRHREMEIAPVLQHSCFFTGIFVLGAAEKPFERLMDVGCWCSGTTDLPWQDCSKVLELGRFNDELQIALIFQLFPQMAYIFIFLARIPCNNSLLELHGLVCPAERVLSVVC